METTLAALALPLVLGIDPAGAARAHVAARGPEILAELSEFLEIPNVSSDLENVRRNANHLVSMLEKRGVAARLLEVDGASPAVFGQIATPGATKTIVFYAHYDGQPVDPDDWTSPPFRPTLRDGDREIPLPKAGAPIDGEWRLFARSASDDKAPIVAMLAALDSLRAANVPLRSNVKFFFEGEEEAGSPNLRRILESHRDALASDVWLFCDGPVHPSRRMQVVFGVRGVLTLGVTVYGPERALHSGHYGNFAPNPAAALAHLLASLRAPDGTILVRGFTDDVRPATDAERRAVVAMPPVEKAIRDSNGFAASERDEPIAQSLERPALNVQGLLAGGVGEKAANAVPAVARAAIDFRLVPDQKPERVKRLVEEHLARAGYHVTHEEPSAETRRSRARIVRLDWGDGYPAARTPLDLGIARAIVRAVASAGPEPPVEVPTLGGSLPLHHFGEILRAPFVIVPIVNHDNDQHAANENLRLRNLFDGIATYAAILAADLEAQLDAR